MKKLTIALLAIFCLLLTAAPAIYAKSDNGNGSDSGAPAAADNGASANAGNPHAPGTTGNPHTSGSTGNPHPAGPPGNPGHPTGNGGNSSSRAASPTPSSAASAPTTRAAGGNGNANGDANGNDNGNNGNDPAGKTTICHRTGTEATPFELITVPDSAIPAHVKHGDLVPGPSGTCTDAVAPLMDPAPADGSGRSGVSDAAPSPADSDAGSQGVASAAESAVSGDDSEEGGSLPFTGFNLATLLVVGLAACAAGLWLRRGHGTTA